MHFARMYDGTKSPLPCFHGVKGPEIVRSLLEIEATFDKNLQILRNVKKTILDVKVEQQQQFIFYFIYNNILLGKPFHKSGFQMGPKISLQT